MVDTIGRMLVAKLIEFNKFIYKNKITRHSHPYFFTMPEVRELEFTFICPELLDDPAHIDEIFNYIFDPSFIHCFDESNTHVVVDIPKGTDCGYWSNTAIHYIPVTALDVNIDRLLDLYNKRFNATTLSMLHYIDMQQVITADDYRDKMNALSKKFHDYLEAVNQIK